jgi:hypothetical protein
MTEQIGGYGVVSASWNETQRAALSEYTVGSDTPAVPFHVTLPRPACAHAGLFVAER